MAILSNPTPLWAGKTFQVQSGAAVTIKRGITTIFAGKPRALPGPSQGYATMQVRDICAAFCRQSFDPQNMWDMLAADAEVLTCFPTDSNALFSIDGGGQNNVQFGFAADWSYRTRNHLYTGADNFLTDPIRAVVHPGMPVLMTSQYLAGTFELMAGGSLCWSANITENGAYNLLGAPVGWSGNEGDVLIRVGGAGGVVSRSFEQAQNCDAWVLYYVNAYGGWDWFIFDGQRVRETNVYTRSGGAVARPLADVAARDRSTYLIEGTRTWELASGWLTDDEAERFALHIPGTPQAILLHIGTTDVFPVEITTAEVQTARNDRRSPAAYTLTVQMTRESIRM